MPETIPYQYRGRIVGGAQAREALAEQERLERGAAPYSAAILNEHVEEPKKESLVNSEKADKETRRKLRDAIPGFHLTLGLAARRTVRGRGR